MISIQRLKISALIGILIIIAFICFISLSKNIENNKNDIIKNKSEIESYYNDRYVFVNKDEIIIGKNKKEVENGYFDISILKTAEQINIKYNKLYKEDKAINEKIDTNYAKDNIIFLNEVFKLKLEKNDIEKLLVEISNNYLLLRNVNNVDNSSIFKEKSIKISKYKISINEINNMLNITINL